MQLSLTIASLATLLLSAFVQAQEETPAPRRGLRGGNNGADNYFALISGAEQEVPSCMSSALGSVIATVRDDSFCIKLSYDVLGSPELFSHVHGPAAVGETGPVIFTMDTNTQQMQCFELTKEQIQDLDDELWYVNIHSEKCPDVAIRGQILPLLSNVSIIVKQLGNTAEAIIEAQI
jgi:hypothetical protein